MGFSNSVVGGLTLVRPAIRSPNFVTGATGWTINADGSAEFNNAVIRGDLVAGGVPPNARMEFADTAHIPADLQAFYSGTIVAALLFWLDNTATDYSFIATSNINNVYYGLSSSGTVRESFRFVGSGATNVWRVPPGRLLQFDTAATGPNISSFSGNLQIGTTGDVRYGLDDGNGYATGVHYNQTIVTTATGATNFVKANFPGLRFVVAKCVGAGGAGGGAALTAAGQAAAGAGGGGGGYAESGISAASLAATEVITVGVGGTVGTAGNNPGNNGGASSFGTWAVAGGGTGGAGNASTAINGNSQGGAGGAATTGNRFAVQGSVGMNGTYGNGFYAQQGSGGASGLGYGGAQRGNAVDAGGNGIAGQLYGGGGSGGHNAAGSGAGTDRTGGAGANGIVILDLYV